MNFTNVIKLKICSNFGCFSKGVSTVGGNLTYLLPPKTSLIGMIGAILGVDFDDYIEINKNKRKYYLESFYDIKLNVQPLFELNTKRVTFNQIFNETKNIHQDVLIKPTYIIYISFPETLENEEKIFIERLKNNQTIYNIYMGKNEFPISYELLDIFPYNSKIVDNNNIEEFFSNKPKIYGFLNRNLVKNTNLRIYKPFDSNIKLLFSKEGGFEKLESYFEYNVKDYPIKRENFTNFTYLPISFFSEKYEGECFFNSFDLIKGSKIELTQINREENIWINMI
jgi:CRISPR-associated protein Cas5h